MITKLIADTLVEENENFYRTDLRMGEVDVFIYNYSSTNSLFDNEYAKEFRGLTITKEKAQERIFLSIPKFFNIDEIPENSIENIQHKKIKKVSNKLDGDLINFIQIEGVTYAKSKHGFETKVAKKSQEILDSSIDLQYFLLDCWSNNYHPNFELIGPNNKHIVDYEEDKLVLISVRSDDGDFIDIDKFNWKYTADTFDTEEYNIDKLLEEQKTKKDCEGFVVKFTDESIVKFKTDDYLEKSLLQEEAKSYKNILNRILNEELDDILIVVTEKRKEELLELENLLIAYIDHWSIFCFEETRLVNNRNTFAEKHKSHKFFLVLMESIKLSNQEDVKKLVIKNILNKYNREEKAKKFFKFLKE